MKGTDKTEGFTFACRLNIMNIMQDCSIWQTKPVCPGALDDIIMFVQLLQKHDLAESSLQTDQHHVSAVGEVGEIQLISGRSHVKVHDA